MSRRPVIAAVAAVVLVAAVWLFAGLFEESPANDSSPVVVCVDSTVSTDEVRGSYLPDLETLVRKVAARQGRFYAAACGANATGSVNWPVKRYFRLRGSYSGDRRREQIANQAKRAIEGTATTEGVSDLVETSSTLNGTPLGEMLAVAARQCEHVGDVCTIYFFTDGEWADGMLRVRDGISDSEEERYVETYLPQLDGLAGTEVNFVGVGYGTNLGAVGLTEAREVAAALVSAAGGEIGHWTVRL